MTRLVELTRDEQTVLDAVALLIPAPWDVRPNGNSARSTSDRLLVDRLGSGWSFGKLWHVLHALRAHGLVSFQASMAADDAHPIRIVWPFAQSYVSERAQAMLRLR